MYKLLKINKRIIVFDISTMIYDTKKVHKVLISKFKNMYTIFEIYRICKKKKYFNIQRFLNDIYLLD